MQAQFRYYLAAHGGKSLVWHAYDLFFAYFLTHWLRLPPPTMGAVAMALMVFGALSDLAAGLWIGRGPDTVARLAHLQWWGALLSVVAFMALFSVFDALPPLLHALCLGLLFQVCYKLYDLPQNALTSVLSHNEAEVLQLSAGRYLLSAAARVAVTCIAYVWLEQRITTDSGLAAFVALVCVPALLSSWLLARRVRPQSESLDMRLGPSRVPSEDAPWPGLRARFAPGLSWLLLAALVNAGTVSVMGRMLPYLGARSHVLIAFSLGTLLFLPVFWRMVSRWGQYAAFLLAAALSAGACLGLAGAFRIDGSTGDLRLDAFAFLYGGGAFGSGMLLWGAAANLIHQHNDAMGRRSDTLNYSVLTLMTKLGIALSLVALGYVLGPEVLLPGADYAKALDQAALLGVAGAVISAMAIRPVMRDRTR